MIVPIKTPQLLSNGGDADASQHEKIALEPNIIETYQLGNTTVHIADNSYRDKTAEEISNVWTDFYTAAWTIWEHSNSNKNTE
jgi:hypothetical protein